MRKTHHHCNIHIICTSIMQFHFSLLSHFTNLFYYYCYYELFDVALTHRTLYIYYQFILMLF